MSPDRTASTGAQASRQPPSSAPLKKTHETPDEPVEDETSGMLTGPNSYSMLNLEQRPSSDEQVRKVEAQLELQKHERRKQLMAVEDKHGKLSEEQQLRPKSKSASVTPSSVESSHALAALKVGGCPAGDLPALAIQAATSAASAPPASTTDAGQNGSTDVKASPLISKENRPNKEAPKEGPRLPSRRILTLDELEDGPPTEKQSWPTYDDDIWD